MKWKNLEKFLKFEWRKAIIASFIFLFFPIPFREPCAEPMIFPKPSGYVSCPENWMLVFLIVDLIKYGLPIQPFGLIILLSIAVVSYVFSCLIILIYDKVRKK